MKKNFAPPPFPIRNPKSLPKEVGRVSNPPGNMVLGGRGESAKLPLKPSRFRVSDRGR